MEYKMIKNTYLQLLKYGVLIIAVLLASCGGSDSNSGGNNTPVFASSDEVSVVENIANVITVIANDSDGDSLSYSLSGGPDQNHFQINNATGVLVFQSTPDYETPLDFDADNIYEVLVSVTDGVSINEQVLEVTILNVNDEPPVLVNTNQVSIIENNLTVLTVVGNDPDDDSLVYSLSGGLDKDLFSINGVSGAITFKSAPDYDNPADSDSDNIYLVQASVSDSIHATSQDITVFVTDTNDTSPVFITPAIASVVENTTTVMTLVASDPDGDGLSYNLTGGVDRALFTIDSILGELAFISNPDFDNPIDDNKDNDYLVQITVSDSVNATSQYVTVSVTDVNDESPMIISLDTASVPENTTSVITVAATDLDSSNLTYTISGGVDQGLFSINGSTGDLSFMSAPDFDNPTDNNKDNIYLVQVSVSDSLFTANQLITVSVNDVFDLNLSYDIKQLNFKWSPVSGASYYKLLENSDGISGFSQVNGNITAGDYQYSIAVHKHDWSNALYKLEAYDDGDVLVASSNEVNTVGASTNAIGYFKASNTDLYDRFGNVIDVSGDGDTLAVTSWNEDSNATGINGDQTDNSATEAGAVYIFTNNNNWDQQAYIKGSNTEAYDRFGWSHALSQDGNTLAIGAHGEQSNATGISGDQSNNSMSAAGAVYIFKRVGGVWAQEEYIKASNTETNDYFGWSVALSDDGNTLSVGAYGEDSSATGVNGDQSNNLADLAGAAYIFRRVSSVWSQEAYIKAPTIGTQFGFNTDLSADGNTLAVAHPGGESVSVYTRSGDIWSVQAEIYETGLDLDGFGQQVALSDDGNTLVTAAAAEDSNATLVNGDEIDNSKGVSGAVFVYKRTGSTWEREAYVKASNTDSGDQFGYSIDISGDSNTLAVGAVGEDSSSKGVDGDQLDNSLGGSGAVYIYEYDGAFWNYKSYVKSSNPDISDAFGAVLSLSDDGEILAVGAPQEDSISTGINGDQLDNSSTSTGAAYLY